MKNRLGEVKAADEAILNIGVTHSFTVRRVINYLLFNIYIYVYNKRKVFWAMKSAVKGAALAKYCATEHQSFSSQ